MALGRQMWGSSHSWPVYYGEALTDMFGGFGPADGADVSTAALHGKLQTFGLRNTHVFTHTLWHEVTGTKYAFTVRVCERARVHMGQWSSRAGTHSTKKNNSYTNFYLCLSLARGVSRWFANCQTNRPRAFFPASRSLQPRCPRNLLFWRARGAEEVTVQARGLQEEVVTRDIWLRAFYYCTGCVYMCVRERKRASHLKVDMY